MRAICRDPGLARTPPDTPRATTPRALRTEARAASRYLMASPRIREVMEESHVVEKTSAEREGRRHFASPPRVSPVLGGSSTKAEWRPSRAMPYLQAQQEEEPKDDAVWKRIGIFEATSKKVSPETPREAPHRSSCGFVAAQQMPSLLEQLRQSPRQQSREHQGLGAMAYFNNDPPAPPSVGVQRGYDSRNTGETDLSIFQPESFEQMTPVPIEVDLQTPWAVDGFDEHSKVESPEKKAVQSARKNESSGALEDGLTVSSLSEGHTAALAFPSRGRNNVQACAAIEHHTPCWATNPLPVKPAAKQITDDLPAYNSDDNVRQLIHHYTEVAAMPPQALTDSPGTDTMARLAPYAMVDSPSPPSLRRNMGASSPLSKIDGIGVSSLMSSGHPAAISSKIRDQIELSALEDHKLQSSTTGNVSGLMALKPLQEDSEDRLQLCDDENRGEVVSKQVRMKDTKAKHPTRSQSMQASRLGGVATSPRSLSQPRRMCLGRSGNNQASCAWSGGLRGQINDKPWTSLKDTQIGKVVPDNLKAIGSRSEAPAARSLQLRSPRMVTRDELKQAKSPEQLEDVTDFMRKGCEARIQTLIQEIGEMSLRNDSMKRRINSFKSEAALVAIADASVSTTRSGSYNSLKLETQPQSSEVSYGYVDESSGLGVPAG